MRERERWLHFDFYSFIEARKVVNEEYKNTTLPALASLGAAAVAKMFQNEVKIGNIHSARGL